MTTKLLIIIVGIVLIGLAVLSSLEKKDSNSKLINPKVGIPLGVLGVLMIIFGSYSSNVGYVTSQMEQISKGNATK